MKKKLVRYLIAAQPEGIDSLYYGNEGTKVKKPLAKEFFTFEDARDFTIEHNIDLKNPLNHIVIK